MTGIQLRKGKRDKKFFGIVYGAPGVGKTTLLANRKGNFFLGNEINAEFDIVGLEHSNTYEDFVNKLCASPQLALNNGCDTIVVDNISDIERFCQQGFLKDKNLATFGGGYGAGYRELEKRMVHLTNLFKGIQDKGLNVILIGHAVEKPTQDPTTGFEGITFRPQVEAKTLHVLSAHADFIFHLHRARTGGKDGLNKPTRFLYTQYYEEVYAKKKSFIHLEDLIVIKDNNSNSWENIHNTIVKGLAGASKPNSHGSHIKANHHVNDQEQVKAPADLVKEYNRLKTELGKKTDVSDIPNGDKLSKERLEKGIKYLKYSLGEK